MPKFSSLYVEDLPSILVANCQHFVQDLETLTLDWVVEEDIVLTPNRNKIKSATKDCLVQTLFYSSCLNPGAGNIFLISLAVTISPKNSTHICTQVPADVSCLHDSG